MQNTVCLQTRREPPRHETKYSAVASGRAVLCINCHVLLAPGAVRRLLDYFAANPNSRDLLTGPLLDDLGLTGHAS